MKKLKIFLYIAIINITILSCSSNDKELSKKTIEQSPRELYQIAMINIDQENYEEAIEIANDTPYGLLNFIQTQDQKKANRVARKLRSGMVDINGAGLAADAPFGGYKHSGIGREAGVLGLEEFLEVKAVGGWNEN